VLDPTTLFTWEPHVDQRTLHARTLVVTLGSYVDAGHAQRLVDGHLLEHLPNRLLGRFDADQLTDYAGRRPTIVFDRTHFSRYERPDITLRVLTDGDGTDFLLLSGPEPAFQWERMAAAVRHVVEQTGVEQTVLLQTMPAPVPHTRPVAVTRYASDPALVAEEPVLGTFALGAAFVGVLTIRLGEAGHPVLGLLAHVPHYVADGDYPAAASALLGALSDTARLALPRQGFELAESLVAARIDRAVAGNEELATLVAALERQYDEVMAPRHLGASDGQQLLSAEEIGQRFEEFLARLERRDDHPDGDGDPSPR